MFTKDVAIDNIYYANIAIDHFIPLIKRHPYYYYYYYY